MEARAARQLVRMTIRPLPTRRRRASKQRSGNFSAAHSLSSLRNQLKGTVPVFASVARYLRTVSVSLRQLLVPQPLSVLLTLLRNYIKPTLIHGQP